MLVVTPTSNTQPGNTTGVAKALEILEQVTSIRVVGEFLKNRGLPFSAGSWSDLREKRITPYIQDGRLKPEELYQLLGEVEEYGRSHVFLYKCKRDVAKRLLGGDVIVARAKAQNIEERLNTTTVLDQPPRPTISEIRHGGTGQTASLAIKIIETREHRKYLGENLENGELTKKWKLEAARAVNTVRLSPSGLLEIRIESHTNSSQYRDDIQRIWTTVATFVPINDFQVFSLSKAKQALWKNRDQLKERLRFSDSLMRNDFGSTVTAATGNSQLDLFDDDGVKNSLDAFFESGAYCDSSNIWWIRQPDGIPGTDLHVLLSGMDNEFAIPANCSREDYEYVLGQLQKASQQAS